MQVRKSIKISSTTSAMGRERDNNSSTLNNNKNCDVL